MRLITWLRFELRAKVQRNASPEKDIVVGFRSMRARTFPFSSATGPDGTETLTWDGL